MYVLTCADTSATSDKRDMQSNKCIIKPTTSNKHLLDYKLLLQINCGGGFVDFENYCN